MKWCQAVRVVGEVQTSCECPKQLSCTYIDYLVSCEMQHLLFVVCPFTTNVVLSEDFLRFQFKQADSLLANILAPADISSTNSGFQVVPVEIQTGGRKFGAFHTVH